jgi:transposase
MEVRSRFEIDDELWAEVQPLIPVSQRRRRYPGRKPIADRLVLNGILPVLPPALPGRTCLRSTATARE